MQMLADALSAKKRRLTLPWETGFMQQVLGSEVRAPGGIFGSNADFLNPSWESNFIRTVYDEERRALRESPDTSSASDSCEPVDSKREGQEGDQAVWPGIARRSDPKPWNVEEEAKRMLAIERWRTIVMQNPRASKTGRQLLEIPDDDKYEKSARVLVKDTFFKKATGTLHMRAGSVLLYMKWLMEVHSAFVWPWSEKYVYEYLSFLRDNRASATRGQRLLEAVGFSHGVFGSDGAVSVLESSRCEGAALISLHTKKQTQQCDALKPRQVAALELGVAKLTNPVDRVISGNFAFLANARSRFSDVKQVVNEPLLDVTEDGEGYVEAIAGETKTSNRKERRLKMLPMVASATGVSGFKWAATWLKEREKLGLQVNRSPLIMAVGFDGAFTMGRMRTSEAVLALRRILHLMGEPVEEDQRIGTHSFKTSLLSYCAKGGLDVSVRKLLGYHANGQEEMALLYSRDAMADPVRKLEGLLCKIRLGTFAPHETRSGRWKTEDAEPILCRSFHLNKDRRVALDPEKVLWEQAGLGLGESAESSSATEQSWITGEPEDLYSMDLLDRARYLVDGCQYEFKPEKCIVKISGCNPWVVTVIAKHAERWTLAQMRCTMIESEYSQALLYVKLDRLDLETKGWDEDRFRQSVVLAVAARLDHREKLCLDAGLQKELELARSAQKPWHSKQTKISYLNAVDEADPNNLSACQGCCLIVSNLLITECSFCLDSGCRECLPTSRLAGEFPGDRCLFCSGLPKEQIDLQLGEGFSLVRTVHCKSCRAVSKFGSLRFHQCESCLSEGCVNCIQLTPLGGALLCPRCLTSERDRVALKVPLDTANAVEESSESSEASASDEDEEDDAEQEAAECAAARLARRPAKLVTKEWCIHWRSRILHRLDSALNSTACGRVFDDKYRIICEPSFCYPRCRVCFGNSDPRAAVILE